jgi:hypothetical protein
VKELQGFLGVINFYPRFIPAATHILKPLTDQLKGAPKPAASIPWMEAMQAAFAAAKAACVRLIHPLPGAKISLLVDASADHIGTALQHRAHPAAPWRPLGFFPWRLDAAQVKYSAFDWKMLACVSGFRPFRHMLEG